MAVEILSPHQVEVCLRRLALQVLERYPEAPTLHLVAVPPQGLLLTDRLQPELEARGRSVRVSIAGAAVPLAPDEPLVVVDDVLNTGRTLYRALHQLGEGPPSGIQVLVLVDRGHRQWPVAADFVGLRLATTLQQYIRVAATGQGGQSLTAYLD